MKYENASAGVSAPPGTSFSSLLLSIQVLGRPLSLELSDTNVYQP
jgi:hypothetical protein